MSILVTGATGRLGRRLVERLLVDGHQVTIATRRPFRAADQFASRVRCIEWHPSCDPAPSDLADGIEAVVNLAAPSYVPPGSKDARLSRAQAALRLTELFHGRPIRLIAVSPVPAPREGDVMTEASRLAPVDPDGHADAASAEAHVNALAANGASVTVVRLGLLLEADGIWDDLADIAMSGREPRFAGAQIPVIDPEDAVSMLAGLIGRRDFDGPLIAVAPQPLQGDVLDAQVRRLRRVPFALPLNRRSAERRLGPLAALLYNRTRIVPQRLLDAGAGFLHPDPHPRLEALFTRLADDAPPRFWPRLTRPSLRPAA